MLRKSVTLALILLLCMGLATGATAQSAYTANATSTVADQRLQLPTIQRSAELSIISANCGFTNQGGGVGMLGGGMLCVSSIQGCKITAVVQRRDTGNGPWLYYTREQNVDLNTNHLDILRYVDLELGYQYQVEFTYVSYNQNLVPQDMVCLTSYAFWYF